MKKKIVGVLVATLVTATVLISIHPASACTGFTTSEDDTVLVGNNEDWFDPDSYIWVYPPEEGKYGRVFFAFNWPIPTNPNYYTDFAGMNDQGLFFDEFAHPPLKPVNSWYKPVYPGELTQYCLEVCSTVDEVLEIYDRYNLYFMKDHQTMYVDRTGASVIIEGDEIIYKEGNYQVCTNFLQSNPEHGWYPCWRYDTAVSMLENMAELSVDYFKSICNATHSEGFAPTVYSSIYDLNKGIIYLYHFHNYDSVLEINLTDEFELGEHTYYLPSLFEPANNRPPNKPSAPLGSISGRIKTEYTYKSTATDPDNTQDQIYYMFDWGDGTFSDWIKHQPECGGQASHIWNKQGNYEIKVKAKDIYGRESDWSDPLPVSMPKNKPFIDIPLFSFLENHPNLLPILRHILKL
jgi:PKD domain-containing protein